MDNLNKRDSFSETYSPVVQGIPSDDEGFWAWWNEAMSQEVFKKEGKTDVSK